MNVAAQKTVDSETEAGEPQFKPYFVDADTAGSSQRSLPVLIASRQCYMCRQGFEDAEIITSDPQDFIDLIAGHCANERDFLLPDTPMKEAIFRVLLAHSNEPMDAVQIGAFLTEKWSMTPFPRNTSAEVIQRLLDSSAHYCIAPVPEPEVQDGS